MMENYIIVEKFLLDFLLFLDELKGVKYVCHKRKENSYDVRISYNLYSTKKEMDNKYRELLPMFGNGA